MKTAFIGFRTTPELKEAMQKEAKRLKISASLLENIILRTAAESFPLELPDKEVYEAWLKMPIKNNRDFTTLCADVLKEVAPFIPEVEQAGILPDISQGYTLRTPKQQKKLKALQKIGKSMENKIIEKTAEHIENTLDVAAIVAAHQPKEKEKLITNFGKSKP